MRSLPSLLLSSFPPSFLPCLLTLFIYSFIYLCIHPSIYQSTHPFIYTSTHLFIHSPSTVTIILSLSPTFLLNAFVDKLQDKLLDTQLFRSSTPFDSTPHSTHHNTVFLREILINFSNSYLHFLHTYIQYTTIKQ